MPSHYDDGEYKGNEHSADIFKAPPKEKTAGEKLEESGEYIDSGEGTDAEGNLLQSVGEGALGVGKGALWGLEKYGQGIDWTNKQVNLRNALMMNPANRLLPQPDAPDWVNKVLDYSFHDLRGHTAGGIGNVVGAVTGSEKANDIAEMAGQVLLPDAIDFATGGVGYLDNIARAGTKLKNLRPEDAARIVDQVFAAKRFQPKQVFEGAVKGVQEGIEGAKERIRGVASIFEGGPGVALQRVGTGGAEAASGGGIRNILDDFPDDIDTFAPVKDIVGDADIKRLRASGLVTGNTVRESGRLLTTFNAYAKRIAETINSTLPKGIQEKLWQLDTPGRTARWHHVGPLKQVATSVNGLTDAAAKNGADYIAEGVGRALGNLEGAGTPLSRKLHERIHKLFNANAGKRADGSLGGYNINQHIETLGWPDNWQEVIPHKGRKPLYDLIIEDVVESETAINTFWTRLNDLVDSSKVNRKQFLNSLHDTDIMDSYFQRAYGANPGKNVTMTALLEEVTGQTNKALTNVVNLLGNTPNSDIMYPVLLREQGMNALWEVIQESRKLPEGQIVSSGEIFRRYNIQLSKGQKAIINQLAKDDDAYQHMIRSRNKNIPPADSTWNFGQDN